MTRTATLAGLIAINGLVSTSCSSEEACETDGTGTVSMENTYSEPFNLVIDGETKARVYPGDTEEVTVEPGEHRVEAKFEGGQDACQALTLMVDQCETEARCCPECSDSGGSQTASCPVDYPLDCGNGYCCPALTYCCGGSSCCS